MLFDVRVFRAMEVEKVIEFHDDGLVGRAGKFTFLGGIVGVGESEVVAAIEDEMPNEGGEFQTHSCHDAIFEFVVDVVAVLIDHVVRAFRYVPCPSSTFFLARTDGIAYLGTCLEHEFETSALASPTHLHEHGELNVVDVVLVFVERSVFNEFFPSHVGIVHFQLNAANRREIFFADVACCESEGWCWFPILLDGGGEVDTRKQKTCIATNG